LVLSGEIDVSDEELVLAAEMDELISKWISLKPYIHLISTLYPREIT